MKVRWEPARIRQTNWKEYVLRFGFGGLVTAFTGFLAHRFGPVVGGLFLAFPAILPATVTLIEGDKGRRPAGVDAAGAVLGSIGLLGYAGIVWGLGTRAPAWAVLTGALVVWFLLSAGLWWGCERLKRWKHHRERRWVWGAWCSAVGSDGSDRSLNSEDRTPSTQHPTPNIGRG